MSANTAALDVVAPFLDDGERSPTPIITRSVRRCLAGKHFLLMRERHGTGTCARRLECRSWRCPKCRAKVAAQNFARIVEALAKEDPDHVCAMVLTLPPELHGKNWHRGYDVLYGRFAKLRKRLEREFEGLHYVSTLERHRDGTPHLNVIAVSSDFSRANVAQAGGWQEVTATLQRHIVGAGFGPVFYCEPMKSVSQLCGYIVKIAARMGGEITKLSQVPDCSPIGCRRIRATQGWLAPMYRGSGEWLAAVAFIGLPDAATDAFAQRLAATWESCDGFAHGQIERIARNLRKLKARKDALRSAQLGPLRNLCMQV